MKMSRKVAWSLSVFWVGFTILGTKRLLDFLDLRLANPDFSAGFIKVIFNLRAEFLTTLLIGLAVIWFITYIFRDNIDKE